VYRDDRPASCPGGREQIPDLSHNRVAADEGMRVARHVVLPLPKRRPRPIDGPDSMGFEQVAQVRHVSPAGGLRKAYPVHSECRPGMRYASLVDHPREQGERCTFALGPISEIGHDHGKPREHGPFGRDALHYEPLQDLVGDRPQARSERP
jgi:hypothetical protein